jgi:hypothetical protein
VPLLTPGSGGRVELSANAILSRFFTVLPSSLEGMVQLVREFESLPTPSLREWKYDLGKGVSLPLRLPEKLIWRVPSKNKLGPISPDGSPLVPFILNYTLGPDLELGNYTV